MIGFDSSSNRGPIVNEIKSINFLTKKKFTQTNTNEAAEISGEEVYEEKWEDIIIEKSIKLSKIEDFTELSNAMSSF